MIDKTWLTAQIDQAAVELRGNQYTHEEIAMLAVACGLEWGAMVLRSSLDMERATREHAASELDRLRDDLLGDQP